MNQTQFRQSSVRVGGSEETSSSDQLGSDCLAHLSTLSSGTSRSCEVIALPVIVAPHSQLLSQKSSQVRAELRRNRSLNEQPSLSTTIGQRLSDNEKESAATSASHHYPVISNTTSRGGSSGDNNYGRPVIAKVLDVGTAATSDGDAVATVGGHQQLQSTVPSITVAVASKKNSSSAVEAPGGVQPVPGDSITCSRDLKVFKHKPIISTSFDSSGHYDDPYYHRYDDDNERLDDNDEKRLFPVRLDEKAKLQSNSDIILRNHSYKSCVKRKSNHSTGNLDDLFLSLRASGDHPPQLAYYYLDEGHTYHQHYHLPAATTTTTTSSSHSPSPSSAAAAAVAAANNATTHSSLHPHPHHPLSSVVAATTATATGVVVVGSASSSSASGGGHAATTATTTKHSLSKSLNCLRKRSAKLKLHLKPLKIAQITTDSDSISISNCQVPITLAQYGNAASSSSLSLVSPGGGASSSGGGGSGPGPLSAGNGQQLYQQQQQQQQQIQTPYVPSGAASSGSSPNRYSSTLPKLSGSTTLNRPRLNSSDSHKVQAKYKSKPVHHHSHQDTICPGYSTPPGSGTAFELTTKSPILSGAAGVGTRPTAAHRHSVAHPPKHLSTQSLTTTAGAGVSVSCGGTPLNSVHNPSHHLNTATTNQQQQQCPSGSNNNTNSGGGSFGATGDSVSGNNNNTSSSCNNQNSASSPSYSSTAASTAQHRQRPSLTASAQNFVQNNLGNSNAAAASSSTHNYYTNNSNNNCSPRSDTRSNNSFNQNIYSASANTVHNNSGNPGASCSSSGGNNTGGNGGGGVKHRVNSDRHVYDFNRQLSAPIENRSSSSSVNNIIPSHNNIALGGYQNGGNGGSGATNYYPHLVGASYTNSLTRNKKHRSLKLTGR